MRRPGPPAAPKAAKPAAMVPGVEQGDEVYVKHPARGPIAGRVLSRGAHGITLECDRKERHQITWDGVLGHKRRMLNRYQVVDQGADGAILEDAAGRRRYVAGEIPMAPAREAASKPEPGARSERSSDDPLTGGHDRLRKAMGTEMTDRVLFLKGGPIANRQGLRLEDRTDKGGHRTKRWVKADKGEPASQPASQPDSSAHGAPMAHGDRVAFRHGDVGGEGKITRSGADGVTLQDDDGNEHQVRHEHLVAPKDQAEGKGAGDAPAPGTAAEDDADKAGGGEEGAGGGEDDFANLFTPEDGKLPVKTVQPTSDPDELWKLSGEALDYMKGWLNSGKGICDALGFATTSSSGSITEDGDGGILLLPTKLKERDGRAREKVDTKYAGDWGKLCDIARCSIVVDRADELPNVVAALKKGGMKLAARPDNRFASPTEVGYRDANLNLTMPNGVVVEMQLHVRSMIVAKSSAGHAGYEKTRALQPLIKAGTITKEQRKVYDDAFQEQERLYASAWTKVTGAAEGGSPMAKAMQARDGRYSFFNHDNATFRRDNSAGYQGVDDVLNERENKWVPYKGDCNEPVWFGSETENPLPDEDAPDAGNGEGEAAMAKSLGARLGAGLRVLFRL